MGRVGLSGGLTNNKPGQPDSTRISCRLSGCLQIRLLITMSLRDSARISLHWVSMLMFDFPLSMNEYNSLLKSLLYVDKKKWRKPNKS